MDESRYGMVRRGRAAQPWCLLMIDPQDFTRQCMADLLRGCDDQLDVRTAASLEQVDDDGCSGCSVILLRTEAAVPPEALQQALDELGAMLPGVPVTLLCGQCDMEAALRAVRCGVRGYLSPSLGVEQILAALRLVCSGGIYIAPLLGVPAFRLPEAPRPVAGLTPREEQVLIHLRQGKPNKLIAYELGMSENTVKAHVGHILKKLGATSRTVIACLPG